MKQSLGNDFKLMQKIAQKDHQAFQEFVGRYQSLIINTCFRLTGDRENAEDVAQEVFFQVYRKAKSFRGQSKLSTWLYRIAVNLSLNFNRKKNLSHYDLQGTGMEAGSEHMEKSYVSSNQSPDSVLEKKEENRFIREAVESLPEKQRTAFILHYWEGLSYLEIADILKTSLSSVESRIHRAKNALRDIILEYIKKK